MTIRKMTSNFEARNDVPISLSDLECFFTAPLVFSTITGIAMIQTTITFDVSPMPYAKTSKGIRAASGAACITMKIGENNQSKFA